MIPSINFALASASLLLIRPNGLEARIVFREFAALFLALAGICGLSAHLRHDSAELAAITFFLLSWLAVRFSLFCSISPLLKGSGNMRRSVAVLFSGFIMASLSLQTVLGHGLRDDSRIAMAAFSIDVVLLSCMTSIALCQLLHDVSVTQKDLIWSQTVPGMTEVHSKCDWRKHFTREARHASLFLSTLFLVTSASLNLLLAAEQHDFGTLVPGTEDGQIAWLCSTIAVVLAIAALRHTDGDAARCVRRAELRKSLSPIWPTQEAFEPRLVIGRISHPFAQSYSPSSAGELLRSIEEEFGIVESHVVGVSEKTEWIDPACSIVSELGLMDLESPTLPWTSGFDQTLPVPPARVHSPATQSEQDLPITPSLQGDGDYQTPFLPPVQYLIMPRSQHDSPPFSPSSSGSPLPSIPEEDEPSVVPITSTSTIIFAALPTRPKPAELSRDLKVTALHSPVPETFNGKDQDMTALGIIV